VPDTSLDTSLDTSSNTSADTPLDLDSWLTRIEQIHPVGWDMGLERVAAVGATLDVLHPAPTTILVAGTNGKGSTCEFIYRFAEASHLTTGLSTSPHLQVFNERIRINGEPVKDELIVDAFKQIDHARGDITLTYFEFASLASMLIFKQQRVDVAILEIGLGGRLDAMNIVAPDLSVITSIALDHQSWLGDSREEIAREKAGVMRRDTLSVIVDRDPPDSLRQYAKDIGARTEWIGLDFDPVVPKACELPPDSFAAANRVAEKMGWETSAANQIAEQTRLPGRRTLIEGDTPILLDVAHNPAAAASLAEYLDSMHIVGDVHALVGMYADKEIEQVTGLLSGNIKTWHLVSMEDPRAASAEDILRRLGTVRHGSARTYDKIEPAYHAMTQVAGEGDLILVFGSFPVVAGMLAILR
jgi:dihydrofolate synthase/folylpolyglutamate synthase